LLRFFERLRADLPRIMSGIRESFPNDQTYCDLEALEGEPRQRLVTHRHREAKLRAAKISAALQANNGRLICEVPRCGFDFAKRYGEIGYGYAHVHHRVPLGKAGRRGHKTTLDDLAIVCANCHAMIHKGGECREDLNTLIPRRRKRTAKRSA
jgi:predicted HNH restriction endonuclease